MITLFVHFFFPLLRSLVSGMSGLLSLSLSGPVLINSSRVPRSEANEGTRNGVQVDFASERSRNGVQVALAVPTLTLTGYGYMYIRINPSVYTCHLIVGFPQVTYLLYCFARDFEKYTEKKLIRPARPAPCCSEGTIFFDIFFDFVGNFARGHRTYGLLSAAHIHPTA